MCGHGLGNGTKTVIRECGACSGGGAERGMKTEGQLGESMEAQSRQKNMQENKVQSRDTFMVGPTHPFI